MIFRNHTHQQIWIEHNCHQCWYHKQDCTILERALRTDRKPKEWQRNPRKTALMQDSIKCEVKTKHAPPVKRGNDFDDVPMFDVEPVATMDAEHA